ncbi:MAG: hypothetical protein ACK4I0_00725 [Brevundimonas sp.]|uniref:hypothetical protein n=1 Tax=Brevundimonas sp. TaxID=1871086 RepID=UPI0039187135
MPKTNDGVQVRVSVRAGGGPFWQTNATVASVSGGSVIVDGFDRVVTAARSEL